MRKKIIATALVMAMLLSLAAPGAVYADPVDKTLNYVVLGSSQTNGYGLHGYVDERFSNWTGSAAETAIWNAYQKDSTELADFDSDANAWNPEERFDCSVSGYRNLVPDSYPELIAQKLKAEGFTVETHQLALSSMRPEELTVLLDDDFDGDAFTDWRFTDKGEQKWFSKDGGLALLREDYQETIANADMITYDLGANNFGAYLSNQLFDADFSTTDLNHVLESSYAGLYYSVRALIEQQLLELAGEDLDEETLALLNNIIDTLAYALLGFMKHFDRNMELIYAMNPDVDITVVSIQNTLEDLEVELEGIPIPLGTIIGIPMRLANAYMAAGSEYSLCYAYADVTTGNGHVKTFLEELLAYEKPEDLTQNMKDCFDVLDDFCFLKQKVTRAIESSAMITRENPDYEAQFQASYTAAYDTVARILKKAASVEPMDAMGLVDGSRKRIRTDLFNAGVEAAKLAWEGADYTGIYQTVIENYEETYSAKDIAFFQFILMTQFGNSFFAHPSPAGCAEAADIIFEAMENNANGYIALGKNLVSTKKELIELGIRYGLKYARLLVEMLSENIEDEGLAAEFSAIFDAYWDEELFAEWITEYIDDGDTEKWLTLLDNMQSVATFMEKSGQIGQVVSGLSAILAKNTQFGVSSLSFTSLIRNRLVKNVVSQIKNFVKTY